MSILVDAVRGRGRPLAREAKNGSGSASLTVFLLLKGPCRSPVATVPRSLDCPSLGHHRPRVCRHGLAAPTIRSRVSSVVRLLVTR